MDGNTHSEFRELMRAFMVLKINLADSKIVTILTNFFVKSEYVG